MRARKKNSAPVCITKLTSFKIFKMVRLPFKRKVRKSYWRGSFPFIWKTQESKYVLGKRRNGSPA